MAGGNRRAEILGGLALVDVHDRGRSKDTDFAVFLIGAHALLCSADYPDFVSLPGDSFSVLVGLPILSRRRLGTQSPEFNDVRRNSE